MQLDHSLRPEAVAAAGPGEGAGCGCPARHGKDGDIADRLDDRTVAYVLDMHPHFDALRQAISQIAGMLVLAAAGAKSVTQDHVMFAAAAEAQRRTLDGIRAARPSARARHHHRHLLDAAEHLGLAIATAGETLHIAAGGQRLSGVYAPLQAAYRHLQWAAGALPGFEILSFDQACCAPQA
jgi:hypothetical protein